MNIACRSTLSVLAESAIGGLTSTATIWLTQRAPAQSGLVAHEILQRKDLYRDFTTAASKVYFSANRSVRELRDLIALGAGIDPLKEFGEAARELGKFKFRATKESPGRLPPAPARRNTWHGRSNMTRNGKRPPRWSEVVMSQRSLRCPKTTQTIDPKPRRTL